MVFDLTGTRYLILMEAGADDMALDGRMERAERFADGER